MVAQQVDVLAAKLKARLKHSLKEHIGKPTTLEELDKLEFNVAKILLNLTPYDVPYARPPEPPPVKLRLKDFDPLWT